MTGSQLTASLQTQPLHICPDGTTQYALMPPHRATDGWVKLHIGKAQYHEKPEWTLAELGYSVLYCPWCGQKLPVGGMP